MHQETRGEATVSGGDGDASAHAKRIKTIFSIVGATATLLVTLAVSTIAKKQLDKSLRPRGATSSSSDLDHAEIDLADMLEVVEGAFDVEEAMSTNEAMSPAGSATCDESDEADGRQKGRAPGDHR